MLDNLVLAIAAALLYAMSTLFSKSLKRDDFEGFEPYKILRTIVLGIAVGGFFWYTGIEATRGNFKEVIASQGFLIVVVDQVSKAIWRYGKEIYKKYFR